MFGKGFKKAWGKGGSGFGKNIWGKGGEKFLGALSGETDARESEAARAQAQAEQQAAAQREAAANAQREAAEAARQQAETLRAEAAAQQQAAVQREAAARAQQAASDAEAKALQAQLDAALKAKEVADMRLQLAKLQQSEQAADVKLADVQQKSTQQVEEDNLREAIAESLSAAAHPPALAASSPPSYEEIEAINQSALEAAMFASQAEAEKVPSMPVQQESAAAGANSLTKDVSNESLEEGVAVSLSSILTEQVRDLTVKLHGSSVLPRDVKLTQEQFNALQTYWFQQFPFTSSKLNIPGATVLQQFATDWLEIIEPHIVDNEADSNLAALTGLHPDPATTYYNFTE